MNLNFKEKTVLITGGSKGIGLSIAESFLAEGAKVIITSRDTENLNSATKNLIEKGFAKDHIQTAALDLSLSSACNSLYEQFPSIDVLVNNAGITRDGAFRKMSYENWKAVLSTNLDSVFNCTRHVINHMIDKGFGRIINISSVNGQRGQFGQANYSAAKAGMHGFTKTLAMEVANKGVTVNTISPGYIGTDMVMAVKEEIRNQIIAQIPMGRLGGTEEVAYLVSFLASEHACFITGANMSINGGQHVY